MKKALAILLSTLMLLALAACGGSTGTSSTPVSGPASASETPTIDAIKAAGKLVMLTNATFPPYEYFTDTYQGVDIDLAQMIADELGVELVVEDMDFDLLIEALNLEKGNIVAAGMSITAERAEAVDFTIPYVDSTLVIVVPEGSDIQSAEDLAGKRIAVQESTTSDLYVSGEIDAGEIVRMKNAVDTGAALLANKADAIVMDILTAESIVAANEGEMFILEEPLAVEQYAMAIKKGQEDFVALVNSVLQKAVDAGTVEELIAYHMQNAQDAAA